MATTLRWTVNDLALFPEPLDDTRYEIVGGELYVSRQPSLEHQMVCANVTRVLGNWSAESGSGTTIIAPGMVFATDEAVAPDIVWVSRERLPLIRGADRKLHGAPELVVEVLSPGAANAERDREIKLDLYARRGVYEYWLVDWELRAIGVYRREGVGLRLTATLYESDVLDSPLLPGFRWPVKHIFAGLD